MIGQNRTPGRDDWTLGSETIRRPALVTGLSQAQRPTMQEIDDGWVLPAEAARSEPVAASTTALLDLNLASLEELQDLPGVGRLRAKRIVALRDKLEGFGAVAELSEVRGVGAKTLAQLNELVAVY